MFFDEKNEELLTDIFQSYCNLLDIDENKLGTDLENALVFAYEGDLQRFHEGLWEVINTAIIRFGLDFDKITALVSAWAKNSARLGEEYQSMKARHLLH